MLMATTLAGTTTVPMVVFGESIESVGIDEDDEEDELDDGEEDDEEDDEDDDLDDEDDTDDGLDDEDENDELDDEDDTGSDTDDNGQSDNSYAEYSFSCDDVAVTTGKSLQIYVSEAIDSSSKLKDSDKEKFYDVYYGFDTYYVDANSSDATVASVTAKKSEGADQLTIKGNKAGTATVKFIYTDKKTNPTTTITVSMKVTVKDASKNDKVSVTKKLTVKKGKSAKIVVKNAGKKKVTYTSKNKKIATVNKKGVVTGKKKGNTKVIVKVGKDSYTCNVKVK